MKNCTLDGATRPPPPPPPPPLFLRYHPQHPQHPQHLTRPLFYIFVSLRSTWLASAHLRWPKTSVELFHHRTRSRRLSSHEKLNRYFRYFCRRHKRRFIRSMYIRSVVASCRNSPSFFLPSKRTRRLSARRRRTLYVVALWLLSCPKELLLLPKSFLQKPKQIRQRCSSVRAYAL